MIRNKERSDTVNKWLYTLGPALITFGPLFIALSSHADTLGMKVIGYSGAVALGFGLALMFRAIRTQQREIDELKSSLMGTGGGDR